MKINRAVLLARGLVLLAVGYASSPVAAAEDGLGIYVDNPYYWQYHGRPVLLLGGSSTPPGGLNDEGMFLWPDLPAKLDKLKAAGGNYTRCLVSGRLRETALWPFAQRGDRYDLDQWNEEYWRLFETFLQETQARGIITDIELWATFDYHREPWARNPFNPKNNVNYTAAQTGLPVEVPSHPSQARNSFFRSLPELDNVAVVLKYQQRFVDRILSYTLRHDHVLYCMDNETTVSPKWGAYWANYVRAAAAKVGRKVPVTEMFDAHDLSHPMHGNVIDHPEVYDFIELAQNNHQKGETHYAKILEVRRRIAASPRPLNNVKIYGVDGGQMGSSREGMQRFWRNLFAGCASARFHEKHLGDSEPALRMIRSARLMTAALDLFHCQPHNDLLGDREPNEAYCLAEPGKQYAVYFPAGGSVRLDLTGCAGDADLRWLDVDAARWGGPAQRRSIQNVGLDAPGPGQWIAVLNAVPSANASRRSRAERYVMPAAQGRGDGADWANAAALASIDAMITAVGAGGIVYVRADAGSYAFATDPVMIAHGGAAGDPVTIMGVDASLRPAQALLVGTRTAWTLPADPEQVTNVSSWSVGPAIFRLAKGADHLMFRFFDFQRAGAPFYLAGPTHTGLTVEDCSAYNVQRFFEHAVGTAHIGTEIRRVTVVGFSKTGIRIRGDSHDILLEDILLNSGRQDGDNFATGVELNDTAHDVTMVRVRAQNCHDTHGNDANRFWNADGFASERGNYNITRIDCTSSGHTDAGFDDKGENVKLIRCTASANKVNYKFWGSSHVNESCQALAPHKRGGTTAQIQYWLAGTGDRLNRPGRAGNLVIQGGRIIDDDPRTIVFMIEGSNAQLRATGVTIQKNVAAAQEVEIKGRDNIFSYDPPSASAAPAVGPLRVHPTNPRYFTDGSKNADGSLKAVYLTGSHTWNNLVDMDKADPPAPFDFTAYLDFLQRYGHNFIRLWTWDSFTWDSRANGGIGKDFVHHVAPLPWGRTGPGNALDGKPKFDLTRFNPEYFDRLRTRVRAAGDRGIYVSVMLFEGWGLSHANRRIRDADGWAYRSHPLHPDNNINGITGDLNGDGNVLEVHSLASPAIAALQAAYIHKVVDAVNDLDNVLYEVINEGGNQEWDWWVVKTVKDYERMKPKQHPVGITGHGGERIATMLASPADWISPGSADGYRDPVPVWEGRKVSLLDTDHIWGVGGNHGWVWRSFLRGHNPIFMDPYDGSILGDRFDPKFELLRRNMGYTLRYTRKMNLAAMTPQGELASTGFCLAESGREYLVYLPEGGEVTVDLSAASGSIAVEWLNPRSGDTTQGQSTSGDQKRSFKSSFEGDAVLYLRRQI